MHKKEPDCFYSQALYVGVRRFELPTSATRTQRAARLRYTPNWIANVVIFLEKKNDPDVFCLQKKRPVRKGKQLPIDQKHRQKCLPAFLCW